jgi:hypothetical protein
VRNLRAKVANHSQISVMKRVRLIGRLFLAPCLPRIEMCGSSSTFHFSCWIIRANLFEFEGKFEGVYGDYESNIHLEFCLNDFL